MNAKYYLTLAKKQGRTKEEYTLEYVYSVLSR